MSTNHDAVLAIGLDNGPQASRTRLREMCVRRIPYSLLDSEDSRELLAVDPDTGALITDLLQLGRVFHVSLTDFTTAHDGTTCLVSADGYRYKLSTGTDVLAWSVLSRAASAPPSSPPPAHGDAYLVPAGPTGDWATFPPGDVAVYTAHGWEPITFGIGRLLYVEDEDSYYHRAASGSWVLGFGTQSLSAGSVFLSTIFGADASFVLKVENQTTNAPPVTTGSGAAYIIGSSPTGAWAGKATKIARDESAGAAHTIYTPAAGDEVYDKNLGYPVAFNGATWQSASGATVGSTYNASATLRSISFGGSVPFDLAYIAATTSCIGFNDNVCTVTHTAKRAGARLKITYRVAFETWGNTVVGNVIGALLSGVKWHGHRGGAALFRDSVTTALDTTQTPIADASVDVVGVVTWNWVPNGFECTFYTTAADAASHTYYVRIMSQVYFDYVTPNDMALYPTYIRNSAIELTEYA